MSARISVSIINYRTATLTINCVQSVPEAAGAALAEIFPDHPALTDCYPFARP